VPIHRNDPRVVEHLNPPHRDDPDDERGQHRLPRGGLGKHKRHDAEHHDRGGEQCFDPAQRPGGEQSAGGRLVRLTRD
jgi:hypothetical protein